jgi:hypothetical protein
MKMKTPRREFLRTAIMGASAGTLIRPARAPAPVRIGVIAELSGPSSGDTGTAAV